MVCTFKVHHIQITTMTLKSCRHFKEKGPLKQIRMGLLSLVLSLDEGVDVLCFLILFFSGFIMVF